MSGTSEEKQIGIIVSVMLTSVILAGFLHDVGWIGLSDSFIFITIASLLVLGGFKSNNPK